MNVHTNCELVCLQTEYPSASEAADRGSRVTRFASAAPEPRAPMLREEVLEQPDGDGRVSLLSIQASAGPLT